MPFAGARNRRRVAPGATLVIGLQQYKILSSQEHVPCGKHPLLSRLQHMRTSHLRRRRRVVTCAPLVHRAEFDDDESVRPAFSNPRVETAKGPAEEEVDVYRSEDEPQEDWR